MRQIPTCLRRTPSEELRAGEGEAVPTQQGALRSLPTESIGPQDFPFPPKHSFPPTQGPSDGTDPETYDAPPPERRDGSPQRATSEMMSGHQKMPCLRTCAHRPSGGYPPPQPHPTHIDSRPNQNSPCGIERSAQQAHLPSRPHGSQIHRTAVDPLVCDLDSQSI